MEELLKAATAFFKAGAAYYEKQSGALPLPLVAAAPAPAAKVEKPPKEKKAKAEPASEPAPAPAPAQPPAELTEEQSGKQVYDYAKNLIQRYPKPVLDGTVDKENNPFPEGYHMARKILAVDFKVGKIADLVHAQRVQFISKVRDLIAKADAAPAPAETGDVGIGV